MRKVIKKLFSLFLIISLTFISTVNCIGEVDVVKSYYLLKYEYKSFLDPLINSGATEAGLIKYFKDVETHLKTHEDLSETTIEIYLKDALLDVATYRQHRNVAAVIMGCYLDEIESYLETGIIPDNLQEVYDAVIRALFGNKDTDKMELVTKYESYLAFHKANKNNYTTESMKVFENSLNQALLVLSDRNATNLSIANAVSDLDTTYAALEKKPEASTDGDGGYSGPTDSPPIIVPDNMESKSFSDVSETYWGNTAIMYLAEKNIVNGFTDGTFRPEALVTREQFAKMICEAFELPLQDDVYVYSDVETDAWYEKYVLIISQSGLMNGMGNQKFGIGKTLIRQDLAVIADRIIKEGFVNEEFEAETSQSVFSDINTVSDYAKSSVLEMQKRGVVNGMEANQFKPFGGVTRAQAAQIIYNLIK